jgi:hypothetical protein
MQLRSMKATVRVLTVILGLANTQEVPAPPAMAAIVTILYALSCRLPTKNVVNA